MSKVLPRRRLDVRAAMIVTAARNIGPEWTSNEESRATIGESTMKTSETVREAGFYSSDCCNEERYFDTGDTFWRCPKCMRLCVWEPIESRVYADEIQVIENRVA
jgi:hypothetical protein